MTTPTVGRAPFDAFSKAWMNKNKTGFLSFHTKQHTFQLLCMCQSHHPCYSFLSNNMAMSFYYSCTSSSKMPTSTRLVKTEMQVENLSTTT